MEQDFTTQWEAVREKVFQYCLSLCKNDHDANDVFQQVALRAWRGYSSFRGDSSFLTWVYTIARRESYRFLELSQRDLERTTQLDQADVNAPPTRHTIEQKLDLKKNWLYEFLEEATSKKLLSEDEFKVIYLRSTLPNAPTWAEIGNQLGRTKEWCATTHSRALEKLRVFVLMYHQELVGGIEEIERAFQNIRPTLTETEIDVFIHIVLEQDHSYRRSGWRTALRSVCQQVGDLLNYKG